MSDLKSKLKSQDGFIAVIALGIFALLTLFGIMVQTVTIDTIESVKNTNRYYEARDMADSVMEYLQFEANNHEPGFNMEADCVYGEFVEDGGNNNLLCSEFEKHLNIQDKNISISTKIKGRPLENQKFKAECSELGYDDGCYVVPFPGTGSAGSRCDLYEPVFDSDTEVMINHSGQQADPNCIEGEDCLSQIDYACNWNKLTFGSSITDRAAIPLYYENSEGELISPFHESNEINGNDLAQNFDLRVRTPCLPCVYDSQNHEPGVNRVCEKGQDPTICVDYDPPEDSERSFLKVSGIEDDDVVVQWQLTGLCENEEGNDEECGMIQFVDYVLSPPQISDNFSAISEGRINNDLSNSLAHPSTDSQHRLLYEGSQLKGIDTNSYNEEYIKFFNFGKLDKIKQPLLTLFLSGKLISQQDRNIPYLEYQLISDKPIGNTSTELDILVNVEGNIFEKTLYQDESKPLIDFAVQN
ncbi:hypothetical protein GF366_01810 [Candidatus Peregrinibacteria bacterium]|nr:hypothetical protein [Candidatus Peregrinibacteria bacterium]